MEEPKTDWVEVVFPIGTTRTFSSIIEGVGKAVSYAVCYGGIDGNHHKAWVIDQMVRALTGCPIEERIEDAAGVFEVQGKSETYVKLVRLACEGEDGAETYGWDEGICP